MCNVQSLSLAINLKILISFLYESGSEFQRIEPLNTIELVPYFLVLVVGSVSKLEVLRLYGIYFLLKVVFKLDRLLKISTKHLN